MKQWIILLNLNLEQYQFLVSAEGHRPCLSSLKTKISPFLFLNLYPVDYLRAKRQSLFLSCFGELLYPL